MELCDFVEYESKLAAWIDQSVRIENFIAVKKRYWDKLKLFEQFFWSRL